MNRMVEWYGEVVTGIFMTAALIYLFAEILAKL